MSQSLPDTVANQFKTRMRETRIALNLSQEELAQRIGSTKQVISTYETGARIPKVPMAVAIASALGTTIGWLCGLAEEQPPAVKSDGGQPADPVDLQLNDLICRLTPDQKKFFLAQLTMLGLI